MNIGKKIKELRKKRDITQERLAEYLNISTQAVSKWENGIALPDITLVPPIAAFFGITTDELLSYSREITDEKLRQYKERLKELNFNFEDEKIITLMRQALKEYPGQYEFMITLAHKLSRVYKRSPQSAAEEIISLCEATVEDCPDDELRQSAKEMLCGYYPLVGRKAEAIELVKTLPEFNSCKEFIMEWALRSEEDKAERVKQNQSNIIMLVQKLVGKLIYLSSDGFMGERMSIEEKIKCAEAALQIYSAIFYEGHTAKNSGQFRHIYERMSELYCLTDTEKALDMLQLAAESAVIYDRQIDSEENYTSLFVCDCKCGHGDYSDTIRLLQLMEQRKAFDTVRETEKFRDIKSYLENCKK